ncbi:hypothetical protein EXIGLDRAFT_721448, partial [Exidia glandulosa HHB12029]
MHLPLELYTLIFAQLSQSDLCAVARVDRVFHELASLLLYRVIRHDFDPPHQLVSLLNGLARRSRIVSRVSTFDLSWKRGTGYSVYVLSAARPALGQMTNLTTLVLDSCLSNIVHILGDVVCPNLRALQSEPSPWFNAFLLRHPHVTELDILPYCDRSDNEVLLPSGSPLTYLGGTGGVLVTALHPQRGRELADGATVHVRGPFSVHWPVFDALEKWKTRTARGLQWLLVSRSAIDVGDALSGLRDPGQGCSHAERVV